MFQLALSILATVTVALVVERVRELGFVATLELGPVAGRDPELLIRALERDAPETALGRVTHASRTSDSGDDEVSDPHIAIEVAVREQQRRLTRGLRALRVLAGCASGLGFAGALFAIGSVHMVDHGLLDLDPERLARVALGEASRTLALGLGTSAFALSSLVVLQERARTATKELDRVAELLFRAA